jgi:hypothetical protein
MQRRRSLDERRESLEVTELRGRGIGGRDEAENQSSKGQCIGTDDKGVTGSREKGVRKVDCENPAVACALAEDDDEAEEEPDRPISLVSVCFQTGRDG